MVNEKENILTHHLNVIDWARSLEHLTEEQWRIPIRPEKWSIAEIIGHFIPWDEFILQSRIPYFRVGKEMPSGPDHEELNRSAAKRSRERTKQEIIEAFVFTRKKLYEAILSMENQEWQNVITIGSNQLTIQDYFLGLAKHDEHHMDQVNECI